MTPVVAGLRQICKENAPAIYFSRERNSEKYPFHVKSDWEPPVQQSVALNNLIFVFLNYFADGRVIPFLRIAKLEK